MFYNYNKILTYNALLNFLIGERGVGKTYGAVKFVTKQFIKKNEQFAYIRRYKSDLKSSVSSFFTSIINNNEFPDHNLSSSHNKFYCDHNVCGFAMTLSTAQDLKSSNFDGVKYIIFDEFIIDEGQKKYYLHNEVETFLNLIETIARMRDVRIFLLGNAGNVVTNPYFLYFDLSLPYNNDIKTFKDGLILLQYMDNQEYRKQKENTKFGKLVKGTSFEKFAIQNQDTHLNRNFIEHKQATSKFSFAFIYKDETFGVWFDYIQGKVYVSKDFIKNTPYIFATTLKDHSENTLFLSSARKYNCWKNFIENYQLGNVRFENQKIKNIVTDLIKSIIVH